MTDNKLMDRVQPMPTTGIAVRVNITYSDGAVLFDAFDQCSATRWSVLHDSYEAVCVHAESLGITNGRMSDVPLGPLHPCLSFDTWITQPKETFKGFYQTKLGRYH